MCPSITGFSYRYIGVLGRRGQEKDKTTEKKRVCFSVSILIRQPKNRLSKTRFSVAKNRQKQWPEKVTFCFRFTILVTRCPAIPPHESCPWIQVNNLPIAPRSWRNVYEILIPILKHRLMFIPMSVEHFAFFRIDRVTNITSYGVESNSTQQHHQQQQQQQQQKHQHRVRTCARWCEKNKGLMCLWYRVIRSLTEKSNESRSSIYRYRARFRRTRKYDTLSNTCLLYTSPSPRD